MQNGSSGISSDGSRRPVRQRTTDSGTGQADAEFEEARPSSLGEEEMQLQIALALSREECEKEQELRRGDDIRLQIAIEESKRAMAARSSSLGSGLDASQKPSTSKSQGAIDDLLSLGLDEIFNQQQNAPNMSGPSTSAQAFSAQSDPWSPRPSTTIPMVATNSFAAEPALIPAPAQNDPWAPTATITSASIYPSLNPPAVAKANPTELEEILEMAPPSAPQNDPWAAFEANNDHQPNSPTDGGQEQPKIGQQRSNVKTPENFLGENSSLVNLDNLLGPSNQTQPKKAATNPFLVGTTASTATTAAVTKNNPFMANERPSPSLNEMLQAKQQQTIPTTSNSGSVNTNGGAQNSPFGPDGSLI